MCVCDCRSEACCLVSPCVRRRAAELIKYLFGIDCTVDAMVSMATGSKEDHNIWLYYDCHHSNPAHLLSSAHVLMNAQTHPGWYRSHEPYTHTHTHIHTHTHTHTRKWVNGVSVSATLAPSLVSTLCNFSKRVRSQGYIHVHFNIQVFNTSHCYHVMSFVCI